MTTILVHGGAGVVGSERHDALRDGVRVAADAGDAILEAGGSALDAVVAAVRVLEDDPEFNAGRGSALTRDATVETDAAIMDGSDQRVGAVAAVPDLGCAIALARAVLDAGEHVLIAGPAAWRFAAEVGITPAPLGSLVTPRALAKWRAARPGTSGGTVGAVARDAAGRFAAATSTGGIAGKRSGRIGDSPIAGAGTWADAHAAISATGDGECIVRVALARGIAARVAAGMPVRAATIAALEELRTITGGTAGVIALAADGFIGVQLSPTMPIAHVTRAGASVARGDSLGEPVG